MSTDTIPVVDLRDLADPARRPAFVRALGDGLAEFGFVAITNHGIDLALLQDAYRLAAETFGLPADAKRTYETPHDGRQRGYTALGVEHAKNQAAGDLKEFWHIGRSLGSDHPLHRSGDVPHNLFPAEVPAFEQTFLSLFAEVDALGVTLLECIGAWLGQPDGWFRDLVADGNSVLRVIHYPPLVGDIPEGAVRAAEHEDINLITILPVSTQSGLELLTRDGVWMPVQVPPNVMVVDTGDMMQLLTAGRLPATTHRVVNPTGPEANLPRYSMPYFLHPHPDSDLTPLNGVGTPLKAKTFLYNRLVEIGVAKA